MVTIIAIIHSAASIQYNCHTIPRQAKSDKPAQFRMYSGDCSVQSPSV